MKKFIIMVVLLFLVAFPVSAKEFITGYDVNNNYNPVKVEKGVYVKGISLTKPTQRLGAFSLYPSTPYKIGSATTSPMYLSPTTASTTLSVSIQNSTALRLNTALIASTTASYLNYTLEFSNDDSNKNWYGEDAYTVTSSNVYTHGSNPLLRSWTPNNSIASTTYKSFYLTNLDAKYLRITASVKGDSAGLYMEAIPVEKSTN